MRAAKRLAYAAALVLTGMMIAPIAAYLLLDDATLVAWIARGAESAAGVDINYREPVKLTRTLSPTLYVSDLSVADPDIGYEVHTSSLEVQISLPRLLQGQLDFPRLWLGDTRAKLSDAATSDKQAMAPSADEAHVLPPMPALRDVRIPRLRIVSRQQEMLLPTLEVEELALTLERDTDTLQLTTHVDIANESVAIATRVPRFHDGFDARVFSFSATAQSAVASLLVNGRLDFAKPQFSIKGMLSAQAADLQQLPIGIQGLRVPGTLTAQAQLAGTIDRLAVSDLRLQWQGPKQSSLEIRGDINDLDDFAGVALDVSGQLGESSWLAAILPDTVGILTHAKLSAQISGAERRLQIRELSLAARDVNELDVSLGGKLDLAVTEGHAKAENMNLELAFNAPTTRAARVLMFDDIPEFGAIEGRANIRSETGPLALENIVVAARDSKGIGVDLQGRIANFPLNPAESNRGYDLAVIIKASQASLMAERLDLDLPLAGPAEASFRIEGDTKALRLERIKAAAGKIHALWFGVEGQIHFRDWDLQDPLQKLNLGLKARSGDTRVLARLLGAELPELGSLNARARLQTVSSQHQITDFQLRTATGAPVAVAVSGAADHVALLPELAVEGIALRVGASTADVTRLDTLFSWQDAIPAIGAVKASAKLSGNDQKLSISDVSITAGKPNILLIETSGRLGTMAAVSDWQPRNAELSVRVSATGSKALAELLGYAVPELGSLAASAKIRDKDRKLGLESGRLVIGDNRAPVIEAEGFVDDLIGTSKTRWDVELNLDEHHIAAFAGKPKLSELGALRGTLQISNGDGSLGIDTLRLKSTGSRQLKLDVSGQYGDFSKPRSLSLTSRLKARDMQALGVLLDQNWPAVGPASIYTRVSKSDEHTVFETRMVADKFELDGDLVAVLDAEPPRLSGKLRARNAFIPQMTEDIKRNRNSKKFFFSREPIAFDWLTKGDLDLSVDVESFDPKFARAKSAQARIKLQSGRLAVSPASVKYPRGQLELDLQIEARNRPLGIRFKAFGESLDPWRSLYIEEFKKQIDADLNIDIELELSGDSAHELAASAKGDVYMVLKNGLLRRDLVDLVFADIIGWVWSKTQHNKYYEFSCGVADYSINHGVVTSRAFLLDSENIAIGGEGTIDLGKEQVDYVFLPKKKSRLISRADPVKVTGALNDPSVKVIPWKSAASTYGTYGTLLFAPYIFAGVTAARFLQDAFDKWSQESPCREYEKRRAAGTGAPP